MNSLDAGPVVRAHLQEAAHGHAEPDPSTVTEQDVQDHLIPPALCKVGQEVHEEKLWRRETHFLYFSPAFKTLLSVCPNQSPVHTGFKCFGWVGGVLIQFGVHFHGIRCKYRHATACKKSLHNIK